MKRNNKKNTKTAAPVPQERAESDASFKSPSNENQTDYGLDFSENHLLEPRTSRRCSTLHRTQIEDECAPEDQSESENQAPIPAQPPSKNVSPSANTRTARGKLALPTRRKQRRPEQLEKRMNREIAQLRARIDCLIPRLPFSRLVREILLNCSNGEVQLITRDALEAIQTSAELYLTQRFEDAYLLTRYRNRVTLEIRDMALVAYFCKTYGRA